MSQETELEVAPSALSKTESREVARQGRPARAPLELAERLGLLLLMIVVAILFGLLRPSTFASVSNAQAIATSQAVLGVAALALMLPLVCGRFDVSVGANIGFCAVAAAGAMSKHGWPLVPAIVLSTGLGAIVGVFNGYLVAYLGV